MACDLPRSGPPPARAGESESKSIESLRPQGSENLLLVPYRGGGFGPQLPPPAPCLTDGHSDQRQTQSARPARGGGRRGSCGRAAERLPPRPWTPVLRPPRRRHSLRCQRRPSGRGRGSRPCRHHVPPLTELSRAAPSRGCPDLPAPSSRASRVSSPVCFVRVGGLLFAFSFSLCLRAKPKEKGESGFLSH